MRRVRRYVLVEGHSRREAAGVFGLSRETMAKMCRYSMPPGYQRTKPAEKPKLGPLLPVIDAILVADHLAPAKQQHSAKRIFERLRDEHGFGGGYTVVKDYVRICRARGREAFVPLAHPPGHAQVDFGQCIGIIGGVRTVMHVLLLRSSPVRRAVREGRSGGDAGSVPGRARLGCCRFGRRAAVDPLRQHQAGGKRGSWAMAGAPGPRFYGAGQPLPVPGPLRSAGQGQRQGEGGGAGEVHPRATFMTPAAGRGLASTVLNAGAGGTVSRAPG